MKLSQHKQREVPLASGVLTLLAELKDFVLRSQASACKATKYLHHQTSPRAPGGTQLFFGGCVPRGFQNVGSRERIFL